MLRALSNAFSCVILTQFVSSPSQWHLTDSSHPHSVEYLARSFWGLQGNILRWHLSVGVGTVGSFPEYPKERGRWRSQQQGWKHTPLPPRLILPQALSQPQSSPACPAPGQQCTVHSTLVVQSPHDWGEKHDATTRQFEECCLLWLFLS